MTEGLRREKNEKIAFAKLLVSLLAPISGMSAKGAHSILTEYIEEVYQFKYNYKYQPAHTLERKVARVAKDEDERIMAKVAAMTVKDK